MSIAPKTARAFWTQYRRNRKQSLPKYAQLRDLIISGIRDGFWNRGDRLPAEQELARATGFSLGTVQKALRELVQDGLIQRRQGRAGSYVTREQKSVDTVWHYLFSDDHHEKFFPVFPRLVQIRRRRDRGGWSLHLKSVDEEVVQIDRVMDIGHDFQVYSEFYLDAHVYDQAAGRDGQIEGVNLRRELNLNIVRFTYDVRIEEIPRDICEQISVPPKSLGMVTEVRAYANPTRQGYFQRSYIPQTRRWLSIGYFGPGGGNGVPRN